jgi:hypothetical protein
MPALSPSETPASPATRPGVTWRAVIIGIALIPLNSYWVVMLETIRYSGHPTTISLFFNAVFTLGVLLLLNGLLKRVAPRWALTPGEALTVYVMVALASALSGHDMIQILVPLMGHPFHFVTPQTPVIARLLPTWLTVRDARALDDMYAGHGTLYTAAHLRAWAGPVLAWMGFIAVLLLVMLCINAVVRRQWTRHERLAYPIVQLPVAMADPQARLFRHRLLWAGIAVAGGIDLLNGLAALWPTLPELQVRAVDLQPLFAYPPWNAMYGFLRSFYPFVIGLGMLLPVDLLFSCWFFFLYWKAMMVISAALGFAQSVGGPYTNEQAFGGYIGIAMVVLWTERKYFRAVWRKALGGGGMEDAGEPVSYRGALLGIGVGFVALVGFMAAAGMAIWLAVALFALYFVFSLSIARMRAELGPPAHDLHYAGPDQMLVRSVGSANLSPASLGMLSMTWWFNRAYRSHPMPVQLEGFKIAERADMDQRKMFWAILAAGIIGSLAAFWALLHCFYRFGPGFDVRPALIFGQEPYLHLGEWLNQPKGPSLQVILAASVGLTTVVAMQVVRARFPGFPFHPLGYAVSTSWSMNYVWMPLLIAWLIKLVILRYGGLRLYQRALPFFFGLILGEFVVGSLWTLVGVVFNVPAYRFWI